MDKLDKAKSLIERLKVELEEQWQIVHDEHCTNMEDCSSFGKTDRECHHPRPTVLDEEI